MKIALIGFGEAGLAIATSLGRRTGDRPALRAFDIKLTDDDDAGHRGGDGRRISHRRC